MSDESGNRDRKAALALEWGFGSDEFESGAQSSFNTSVPGPGAPERVARFTAAQKLGLILLAFCLSGMGFVSLREFKNNRIWNRVEREVVAVYHLELEAIQARDVDLLQDLQAPGRSDAAEQLLGPPRPLPSIELSNESTVVDVVLVPQPAGGASPATRILNRVDLEIRYRAVGDGDFIERRRYVRNAVGDWKHGWLPPPARNDLETVQDLKWIDATASKEDLEVVTPALQFADSLLDRLCAGETGCEDLRQFRFSGNRAGRLTEVSASGGPVIALPSPALTFRPADEAGELRYAREIAKIVLLSAAGQDVSLEQEYEQFLTGETGRAPLLRSELRHAFLADFGLADEQLSPIVAPGPNFGSVWDLWWSQYRFRDIMTRSDDELASAARHLVQNLVAVRGADAHELLIALNRASTPTGFFEGSLSPEEAYEVVTSWPAPPPPFPVSRPLALKSQWDGRGAWLVFPGGEPIDLTPVCDDRSVAAQAAWSPDGRRVAVVCSSGQGSWKNFSLVVVDVDSLDGLASIPIPSGAILDLEWTANGRLVWDAWGPSGISARWAWPENGALIGEIAPFGRTVLEDRNVEYTFGADGRRVLAAVRSGPLRPILMFDLDNPNKSLWLIKGRSAAWDGRSERMAAISGLHSVETTPAMTTDVAPEQLDQRQLAVRVTINAVDTGRELAARTIGYSDVVPYSGPGGAVGPYIQGGPVPDWESASVVGIDDASDQVAINMPLGIPSAEDSSVVQHASGAVVIWTIGSEAAPIVLHYTNPVEAEWIAHDHPDAPPQGEGAVLYAATTAMGLPRIDNLTRTTGFETVRTSGERRTLVRPLDEIDPSGKWRIRSKTGRVEIRNESDESLAWWFNAPLSSRFRWAEPSD